MMLEMSQRLPAGLHQWPGTAGPRGHNWQICTHEHTHMHFPGLLFIFTPRSTANHMTAKMLTISQ